MKKRLCALLLALLLAVGAVSPAAAARSERLPALHTYRGQFTDVAQGDWFYENVKTLYELGLTNGQGSRTSFAPSATITLAEAVTMAARLRSLYELGSSEKGPQLCHSGDSSWYGSYVAYAQRMGIIANEFADSYGQSATRAQLAHILADALPASFCPAINDAAVTEGYASRSYIRDVTEYTPYQQDILTLYRWGILSGMDSTGAFHPGEAVQRSEAAAMLTRLARSQLRITLHWSAGASRQGTTYADLVTSTGVFHPAPDADDAQAIDDNIRYMLSRGEHTMSLSYSRGSLTTARVNELLSAFLNGIRLYAEQGYNQVECVRSNITGSLTLTFSCSLWEPQQLAQYRETALQSAIAVHDQLWESGVITASMSQYDRARAYYTWLCQHCQYDHAADDGSINHSAYGAFVNGLAVCDGYTAAYGLLLKLEGIDCSTMSRGDHIWTTATLDGVPYHIDPTWGDQSGTITYRYFAMTEATSLARFP